MKKVFKSKKQSADIHAAGNMNDRKNIGPD